MQDARDIYSLTVSGSWPPCKPAIGRTDLLLQVSACRSHRSLIKQALMDLHESCGRNLREWYRKAFIDFAALLEERGGYEYQLFMEALVR